MFHPLFFSFTLSSLLSNINYPFFDFDCWIEYLESTLVQQPASSRIIQDFQKQIFFRWKNSWIFIKWFPCNPRSPNKSNFAAAGFNQFGASVTIHICTSCNLVLALINCHLLDETVFTVITRDYWWKPWNDLWITKWIICKNFLLSLVSLSNSQHFSSNLFVITCVVFSSWWFLHHHTFFVSWWFWSEAFQLNRKWSKFSQRLSQVLLNVWPKGNECFAKMRFPGV